MLDWRADRRGFAQRPRASAYFVGGAVVYTRIARGASRYRRSRDGGLAASTEPYALLFARRMRERHYTTWALGETGATGPAGNRYGDAAGHAVSRSSDLIERAITLESGSAERRANMEAFTKRALELFYEVISAKA